MGETHGACFQKELKAPKGPSACQVDAFETKQLPLTSRKGDPFPLPGAFRDCVVTARMGMIVFNDMPLHSKVDRLLDVARPANEAKDAARAASSHLQ